MLCDAMIFLHLRSLSFNSPLNAGVLHNAFLRHLHQYRQFLLQLDSLLCECRRIAKGLPDESCTLDNLIPLRHQPIECRNKGFLDFLLRHMGCLTFLPIVLVVAAVDNAPVFVCRVPNFSAEITAALTAPDFAGKDGDSAVASALLRPPLHLPLHHLEHGRVDDGGMALLHEVARHLSAVLDSFLGEKIRREGLLNPRAAHVFLVGEDALDGLGISLLLARDRQNMTRGQLLGNSAGRHSFKKKSEDESHDLCLLLVDSEIAVLTFIVAEKVRVSDGELAVGKIFS